MCFLRWSLFAGRQIYGARGSLVHDAFIDRTRYKALQAIAELKVCLFTLARISIVFLFLKEHQKDGSLTLERMK